MNSETAQALLGSMDIYLIDQLMKNRYLHTDKILDAGCGAGRNMHWFLQHDMDVVGVDRDEQAIAELKRANPSAHPDKFQCVDLAYLTFPDDYFDHVISSAVLHFAKSRAEFFIMLRQILRVTKPGGSVFIRMTSDIGIEDKVSLVGDGVYLLPDGSSRFLLTRELLADIFEEFPLSFIEPFKTVNVSDKRVMCTMVVQKN